MKKYLYTTLSLFLLLTVLASCSTESSTHESESSQNVESSYASSYSSPSAEDEIKLPMEIVEYPNFDNISAYYELTEEQQIAFDTISQVISDYIESGVNFDKVYCFSKAVNRSDIETASMLLQSNFQNVNDIFGRFEYGNTESNDSDLRNIMYFRDDDIDGDLGKWRNDFLKEKDIAVSILKSLTYDGTEYGKAFAVYDWLIKNVDYEYFSLGTVSETFTTHITNCSGYAKTLDFMCKLVGLETTCVRSVGVLPGHMWNMIRINGNWYHIDASTDNENDPYCEFMQSDNVYYGKREFSKSVYYKEFNSDLSPINRVTLNAQFSYGQYNFKTCDEARNFLRTEISEKPNPYLYVSFDTESELEKFIEAGAMFSPALQCYVFPEKADVNLAIVTFN